MKNTMNWRLINESFANEVFIDEYGIQYTMEMNSNGNIQRKRIYSRPDDNPEPFGFYEDGYKYVEVFIPRNGINKFRRRGIMKYDSKGNYSIHHYNDWSWRVSPYEIFNAELKAIKYALRYDSQLKRTLMNHKMRHNLRCYTTHCGVTSVNGNDMRRCNQWIGDMLMVEAFSESPCKGSYFTAYTKGMKLKYILEKFKTDEFKDEYWERRAFNNFVEDHLHTRNKKEEMTNDWIDFQNRYVHTLDERSLTLLNEPIVILWREFSVACCSGTYAFMKSYKIWSIQDIYQILNRIEQIPNDRYNNRIWYVKLKKFIHYIRFKDYPKENPKEMKELIDKFNSEFLCY